MPLDYDAFLPISDTRTWLRLLFTAFLLRLRSPFEADI